MVNHGASRGCITCRKRHVKCDETKPSCSNCKRISRGCEGYGRQAMRVRFRDETTRYRTAHVHHAVADGTAGQEQAREPDEPKELTTTRKSPRALRNHVSIIRSPQPEQLNVAVAFYLRYVTSVGRNQESSRGFLELVNPVLSAESHQSALSAAVTATAFKTWALLSPSVVADSLQIQLHNQALVKLQDAIYSPIEQEKDATVLAAIMLQQYDTLGAIRDHKKPHGTHRAGAMALLKQNGRKLRNFKYHGHLLGNLFHAQISFCVRHNVPLTRSQLQWTQSEVIPALPTNPSSQLDIIGLSISRLQCALTRSMSAQEELALEAHQELPAIIYTADCQLQMWLNAVPELWHPRTIDKYEPTTVTTYHGSCDIYPSLQITNIWNTWRMYCLIVEHGRMSLATRRLVSEPAFVSDAQGFALLSDKTDTQRLRDIQGIVASVCRSIPFYLGNCSRSINLYDINNPQLVFPSYHDLPPEDEALINYKQSDLFASKIDHYRHVALHGPLHALSVLSQLVSLLSDDQPLVPAQGLLYKQNQWIQEQFQRTLYLMRFAVRDSESTAQSRCLGPPDRAIQALPLQAQANNIKEFLSTVTIL